MLNKRIRPEALYTLKVRKGGTKKFCVVVEFLKSFYKRLKIFRKEVENAN